jgi:hypothetical protein
MGVVILKLMLHDGASEDDYTKVEPITWSEGACIRWEKGSKPIQPVSFRLSKLIQFT